MRKNLLKKLSMAVTTVMFLGLSVQAQTTYYVKTDGANADPTTATSWGAASNDLQAVINATSSGDKIFVAAGTYKPNRPADDIATIDATNRRNSFLLKNGVNVYGGFSATTPETDENSRTDVTTNATILSGDLNGNDVAGITIANKGENTYHVVVGINITSTTTVDGFTITGGFANGTTTMTIEGHGVNNKLGAGVYLFGATNITLNNLKIINNAAEGTGTTLTSKGGAGMLFDANAATTTSAITNCTITDNFSTTYNASTNIYGTTSLTGVGLSLYGGVTINNTVFSGNLGNYGAGASMFSGTDSYEVTFNKCSFLDNKVGSNNNAAGAGVNIAGGSSASIIATAKFNACTFKGNQVNQTSNGGGGIWLNSYGALDVRNSIFYQNRSSANGPAIGMSSSNNQVINIVNNTFYQNENTRAAANAGYSACLQVRNFSSIAINNNIFWDNYFSDGSAGVSGSKHAYDNTHGDINGSPTAANVNNNLWRLNKAGTTNITITVAALSTNGTDLSGDAVTYAAYLALPKFISTTYGDLAFLAPKGDGTDDSPALNAGDDAKYSDINTATDYFGRTRVNGGTVDIGAIEYYTVLPVNFISFAAKATTMGVQLSWKVASETGHKQYIVSRSTNGTDYTLVGTTTAYSLLDKNVSAGTYYYKLEQQDNDGKVNYLATQVVKVGLTANALLAYPNPTKGNATVSVAAGQYSQYSVVSLQGTTVLKGNIANGNTEVNVDLSSLSAGSYIIKLIGANGNTTTRVIKL